MDDTNKGLALNDLSEIYSLPTNANYPECLRKLYAVNSRLNKFGIQMPSEGSLESMNNIYELIGRPLDRIPTIHVGGTNGKGSTSWKVAKCLEACTMKTGLFVSPHIASYRERVQVDNEFISEEALCTHLPKIFALCAQHAIPCTLFELTFALACLHFESEKCDAVVLEVGLGGKLDATNVVRTALSILCSVSLDHTRILGSTVEEIATVKSGIFKENVPALIGLGTPISILHDTAVRVGAQFHRVDDVLISSLSESSKFPFLFRDQIHLLQTEEKDDEDFIVDTDAINKDLSLAALCILSTRYESFNKLTSSLFASKICEASSSRPPCRWEQHSVGVKLQNGEVSNVQVVFDVGHNPAAVGALARRINRDYKDRPVRVLYGVSRDKDVRTCLRAIITATTHDRIHFAQSGNFRATSTVDLKRIFAEETGKSMTDISPTAESLSEAIGDVLRATAEEVPINSGVLIVCGTGYLMPEAKAAVGIREPRDDIDLLRVS